MKKLLSIFLITLTVFFVVGCGKTDIDDDLECCFITLSENQFRSNDEVEDPNIEGNPSGYNDDDFGLEGNPITWEENEQATEDIELYYCDLNPKKFTSSDLYYMNGINSTEFQELCQPLVMYNVQGDEVFLTETTVTKDHLYNNPSEYKDQYFKFVDGYNDTIEITYTGYLEDYPYYESNLYNIILIDVRDDTTLPAISEGDLINAYVMFVSIFNAKNEPWYMFFMVDAYKK